MIFPMLLTRLYMKLSKLSTYAVNLFMSAFADKYLFQPLPLIESEFVFIVAREGWKITSSVTKIESSGTSKLLSLLLLRCSERRRY